MARPRRVFLDTNVLAYRFDDADPEKQALARGLAQSHPDVTFVVSTQVLLELANVLTRKLEPPRPLDVIGEIVSRFAPFAEPTDARLVLRALATAARYQLSIWDAMIVESAADAGCDELWTEDLAVGAVVRGLRVVDPFLERTSPR